MLLQLALDVDTIGKALSLLREVGDLFDLIEVGTGLIKKEGIRAVREIRTAFPQAFVLADLKTADDGRSEATLAFDAGADATTVLAAADLQTVVNTVEVARELGRSVVADLIGVDNTHSRVRELAPLGVNWICLHAGADQRETESDPRELISGANNLRRFFDARISVAGGITPASASALLGAADVLVVGQYVVGAARPRVAASRMRESVAPPPTMHPDAMERIE